MPASDLKDFGVREEIQRHTAFRFLRSLIQVLQALGAPGGLTVHTLELPEGTLFALGAGGGRSGTSAVVGGTGGFAGARGTLSLRETAGNGVRAELEITLSLT